MLYTGVDIIEIERMEQAVTRWGTRFVGRVFTPGEQRDCAARVPSLAARWAAKEAAAKALGVGLVGLGLPPQPVEERAVKLQEIEVQRAPTGQPLLILHGGAAERATTLGWRSVSLSLSHSRDYAVAFVVAEA